MQVFKLVHAPICLMGKLCFGTATGGPFIHEEWGRVLFYSKEFQLLGNRKALHKYFPHGRVSRSWPF